MYSDAVPAAPSTTDVTFTHWFAVTPHEPDCTSCSTPPDLMPTSGDRPEPQLSDAKKYSVAEDSLPMFQRKWKVLSIAAEALTSATTVADCLAGEQPVRQLDPVAGRGLGPPRSVSELPVQSDACTLRTVAGPRVEPAAVLGTVAPDAWVKRYSATRPLPGTTALALLTPRPSTMAPMAAAATGTWNGRKDTRMSLSIK